MLFWNLNSIKMKLYNTIKRTSLLVFVSVLANSCTKDFEKLNTPPNLISEELVTPEFLLSGVQFGAGSGLSASDAGNYCGMDVSVSNKPFGDSFDEGAWNLNY